MKNEKVSAKKETALEETKVHHLTTADQGKNTFQGLVASDIIIPKILLMQGMSELVKDRKAQIGDIIRSTTGEKLGDPEHAVEFIPLAFPESYWVIEVEQNKKFEYKKMIPRTAANARLEWKFKCDKDGNEVDPHTPHAFDGRRVQRLALYALLPNDVLADATERKKAEKGEFPDFSKALMPVLIAFRSLSFNAGKEVVSFFTQAESFGRPACSAVLKLKCHQEQNDKGAFYVLDVDRARPTPVAKEHLQAVEYWAKTVSTQSLRVDDADEEVTEVKPSSEGHF